VTARAAPRRRRPADEAQRAILDAAERRLLAQGPSSLRLQEIAREVGVSHPAVLHHFGSREGLLRAVIERALGGLEEDLLRAFSGPANEALDPDALLGRVFETLGDRGHARLLAWLVLSGEGARPRGANARFLRRLAEALHGRRRGRLSEAAWKAALEDTQFAVHLAAAAAIGDAVMGDVLRGSAGQGRDRGAAARFRGWLAALLAEHLTRAPVAPASRSRR
jgi:AcrR family transcriptional regulator